MALRCLHSTNSNFKWCDSGNGGDVHTITGYAKNPPS